MAIEPMREEARGRVRAALAEKGWNVADLAREAKIDPGTIGDFLNGTRWPQLATRQKIDRALGWWPGSIDFYARGQVPPSSADDENVGGADQDGGVLLNLPAEALEGLDAMQRREVIAAAELAALERAREVRRRIDS